MTLLGDHRNIMSPPFKLDFFYFSYSVLPYFILLLSDFVYSPVFILFSVFLGCLVGWLNAAAIDRFRTLR